MALSERAIKCAEIKEKTYRITGDDGLFIEVRPSGKKVFRARYWYKGRDTVTTIGEWPYISLIEAKEKLFDLRKMLANGIDPRALAKYEAEAEKRRARSFADIAEVWMEKKRAELVSAKNIALVESRLKTYILPILGGMTPDDITPTDVLYDVLEPLVKSGRVPTAQRIMSMCGQIFRYGVIMGWAKRDPTRDLVGALPSTKQKHFATITEHDRFGGLLRAIDDYHGSIVVREALKLQYLTFVRPGELRCAEWTEVDMRAAIWRIPPEKMKMKKMHLVPLSRQALAVLNNIAEVTGRYRYIFPAPRSYTGSRPMSDMTLGAALKTMGFVGENSMTVHGFRHAASTMLNESGRWHLDAIERQLAHTDKDKVRATYNYAEYIEERREMMQWWADQCDEMRTATSV